MEHSTGVFCGFVGRVKLSGGCFDTRVSRTLVQGQQKWGDLKWGQARRLSGWELDQLSSQHK